jgi:nucleotide-binding universal stress UspA family protein
MTTELPHYANILLATDGSSLAEGAMRHAVALARLSGAALTILYVVDTHLAFMLGVLRQEAIDELREDGRRALASAGDAARQAGVEHHVCRGEGRPGEAIIAEVERTSVDLIVMGSHGQGALAGLLLGSVSQYVVHHANVPVCIVPPPR